tara:strand:- start:936 stop:1115 length:180 start_codon:yes stop_codon:yes gene_type:complete
MDRVNKIISQNGSIEETINKEDNIEFIKQKLQDKENIPIKKQRLVFKIIEENGDYKEID